MKHNGNAYDLGEVVWIERQKTGDSLKAIAVKLGVTKNQVSSALYRFEGKLSKLETKKTGQETTQNGAWENPDAESKSIAQNAANVVSDPFPTVSETTKTVSFWREWWRVFHPADLLYYLAISLAAVGIIQALHMVGYPVAVLFCAGAFIALHGIKTETGWNRLPHFAIMLVIEAGGFVAHTVWANRALWNRVKDLPLDIWAYKYPNDLGEIEQIWRGSDVEIPGTIALGVAGFMLAFTLYVCWLAIQNSRVGDGIK